MGVVNNFANTVSLYATTPHSFLLSREKWNFIKEEGGCCPFCIGYILFAKAPYTTHTMASMTSDDICCFPVYPHLPYVSFEAVPVSVTLLEICTVLYRMACTALTNTAVQLHDILGGG